MNYKTALFKIGGKILEDLENLNSTISQLMELHNENLIEKVILIPGGGSLANFIRKVYRELKFTKELAHWMGIISMNYNGLELNKKFPKFEITEDFNRLKKLDKSLSIFLPYEFLKENDKLPHSWDVTSDSITLFIANELGLNECFLIKDVEGILDSTHQVIKEISTSEFKEMKESGKLAEVKTSIDDLKERSNPIDPYITTLIDRYKISCTILDGSTNTFRILKYFKLTKPEDKIYSKIT
jgi:aspartokinase-like uncharacterized kinase